MISGGWPLWLGVYFAITIAAVAAALVLASLVGCSGQVPKSYSWRKVDCEYHRDGVDVSAQCELEGTAELGQRELGNVFE